MNINFMKRISFLLFFSFSATIIAVIFFYRPPASSIPDPTSNSDAQKLKLDETMNGDTNTIRVRKKSLFDGRKSFKANCSACHYLGDRPSTGPGMKGLSDRVPSKDWAFQYTKNSIPVLKSNDPYAIKLKKLYPNRMTIFEGVLSDEEIKAIIDFIWTDPGDTQPVN